MQPRPAVDAQLSLEVLDHLGVQIESARRLLASVLAQGAAIRARNVDRVLSHLGELKTEMARRSMLEQNRSELLTRAGSALGVAPAAVTLEAITVLMPPAEANRARVLSAELKGLLAEVVREHGLNRALMRQELAFLDHLLRLLSQQPDTGYSPAGGSEPPKQAHNLLNVQV